MIEEALAIASDSLQLERLSAPAGLGLGGNESAEIALSILAEIQWRRQAGSLLPLRDLRQAQTTKTASVSDDKACPGRRN